MITAIIKMKVQEAICFCQENLRAVVIIAQSVLYCATVFYTLWGAYNIAYYFGHNPIGYGASVLFLKFGLKSAKKVSKIFAIELANIIRTINQDY